MEPPFRGKGGAVSKNDRVDEPELQPVIYRGIPMHMNEVRGIAKGMGINTFGMTKIDTIRAVQRLENNIPCFATDRVTYCNEERCLWRNDCVLLNAGRKPE